MKGISAKSVIYKNLLLLIFLILGYNTLFASNLKLAELSSGKYIIIAEQQFHQDYGLQYPVTYVFSIKQECDSLIALKKGHINDKWEIIPARSDTMFYNGIEGLRFDRDYQKVYVSTAFMSASDSLFLQIADPDSIPIPVEYLGISKFYDNRKATVTATIDDVAYWFNPHFVNGAKQFQKRKIWVNLGIISDACDESNTWQDVQDLLDNGYTEASAHSQTHPFIPYGGNLEWEVSGCLSSIKTNLDLPPLYKSGEEEYVYTWLCPYGQHDNHVDSLLGVENVLVNRLYEPPYFYGFADWDSTYGLFEPLLVSREMGNTDWESYATTNLDTLNGQFDDAYAVNGVYHLVMHPQTVDWNGNYAQQHLDYIGQRKDVWYASLGHLYLYRLMYLNQPEVISSIEVNQMAVTIPRDFYLYQNYPNPFNPRTTIRFSVTEQTEITFKIFDMLGEEICVLTKQVYNVGIHSVSWDGKNRNGNDVSSGIYFYELQSKKYSAANKCILIR
jgi:hypothetical protein